MLINSDGSPMYCNHTGKVCYTEQDCGMILNKLKKRSYGNSKGQKFYKSCKKKGKIPKRKYKCEYCRYWHLTSSGERKNNRYNNY